MALDRLDGHAGADDVSDVHPMYRPTVQPVRVPRTAEPTPLDFPADRLVPGDAFVFDIPDRTPAIWGSGEAVLWAEGEALMIAGPTGVGKSTLCTQLVAGRLGIVGDVLGYPVEEDEHSPVLYVAMDRPAQIRRLLHRYFAHYDARPVLKDRLVVWSGPLPSTLNADSTVLVELAEKVGAGTVVVDSLKDAAVKLTDDESGGRINRAFQLVTAAGVELVVLHHNRKAPADATKAPKALDDIYGSALVPAGMGSVVVLHGAAGDPVVDLLHLKQPAEQVGPLKIEHDADGHSRALEDWDPLAFLKHRGERGATAREAAQAMLNKASPTASEVARAKRKLDGLLRHYTDNVRREVPSSGGEPGQPAARWHWADGLNELSEPCDGPCDAGVAA